MTDRLSRIHNASPGAFDPNAPPGPVAGEIVAEAAGPSPGLGILRAVGPATLVLERLVVGNNVSLGAAGAGSAVETLTVTATDENATALVGAHFILSIDSDGPMVSVASAAVGSTQAAIPVGDAMIITGTTGAGGIWRADVTGTAAQPSRGSVSLLTPGVGNGGTTWTFPA